MGEQGKINRLEHTASGFRGTEKLQRRAGPSPLEVGGRKEGKGANSVPEKPPRPTWQTGPWFLSKDFLRPNRRRTLGPRREKVRRAWGEGARGFGCLGRSPRREKARRTRGEVAQTSGCPGRCHGGKRRTTPGRTHASLWLPGPLRPVKTHMQAQPNPRCCRGHENWNRTQRRARSI